MRGAVNIEHSLGSDFLLTGGIDAVASVHADHKAYLQQCFANLQWKGFFLEAGSREQKSVLRNSLLSVGHFAKGINAKPMPQVHIGTTDFWTVPYTKGWLQIHFDGGYGKLMDSNYREEAFKAAPDVNAGYATGKLSRLLQTSMQVMPQASISTKSISTSAPIPISVSLLLPESNTWCSLAVRATRR